MKLSDQVTSLELSKRLKKLKVKQKSLFYWATFKNTSSPVEQRDEERQTIIGEWEKSDHKERSYLKDIKFYSAFTVSELVKILPATIGNPHLEMGKWSNGRYGLEYICLDDAHAEAETFANACGKMLILLIENSLVLPNGII